MTTAMARLPCKQTSPSQQSRVNNFGNSRHSYWDMQSRQPTPPYVRNHHHRHSDHSGKRKSAVELLQETKAFYVKSEIVLDRKQELKNSGHLQVSQLSAASAPPRLYRKCAANAATCSVIQAPSPSPSPSPLPSPLPSPSPSQLQQLPATSLAGGSSSTAAAVAAACCWSACYEQDRRKSAALTGNLIKPATFPIKRHCLPVDPADGILHSQQTLPPLLLPPKSPRLVPVPQRRTVSGSTNCSATSDQLQTKLRRLLNTDSKENVFFNDSPTQSVALLQTTANGALGHRSDKYSLRYSTGCHSGGDSNNNNEVDNDDDDNDDDDDDDNDDGDGDGDGDEDEDDDDDDEDDVDDDDDDDDDEDDDDDKGGGGGGSGGGGDVGVGGSARGCDGDGGGGAGGGKNGGHGEDGIDVGDGVDNGRVWTVAAAATAATVSASADVASTGSPSAAAVSSTAFAATAAAAAAVVSSVSASVSVAAVAVAAAARSTLPPPSFGRSNSHSHTSRRMDDRRSNDCPSVVENAICHKSLPDLHTSTRRRASLSPRVSVKSPMKQQHPLAVVGAHHPPPPHHHHHHHHHHHRRRRRHHHHHHRHRQSKSSSATATMALVASSSSAAAAATTAASPTRNCPDCETSSDYSEHSFKRDSVCYRSSRHIRRSLGSGGGGDASSVLSSGGRTQRSSGSSKLSHGATARDSGGSSGHCTHRSEPPPRIQDCWSHIRRDSGASTQHSTEKDRSRRGSYMSGGCLTSGCVAGDNSGVGGCSTSPPANRRSVYNSYNSSDSDSSDSQTDYSPTCNSRFSDGWKEGRGRPILRSKSDISDRYWRQDNGWSNKLSVRPPRSITQLENFFDRLGLDSDNYQRITEPDSKSSSPVFFDSVSSVDSALGLYSWVRGGGGGGGGTGVGAVNVCSSSGGGGGGSNNQANQTSPWQNNNCSMGMGNDDCNQRVSDPPSIVERNARIIKWLCQCRKVQFGYS